MFYTFEVGNESYKLKLRTTDLITLEKKLGVNPVLIFGTSMSNLKVPTITELVSVIACAFPAYNHGIKETDVYDIIDKWVEDGHSTNELSRVVVDIYKASGLYKEDEIKNV